VNLTANLKWMAQGKLPVLGTSPEPSAKRSSCRNIPMQCGTFFRSLPQHVVGSYRISPYHFVGGDSDADIFVAAFKPH
jgi:hypothetical protein